MNKIIYLVILILFCNPLAAQVKNAKTIFIEISKRDGNFVSQLLLKDEASQFVRKDDGNPSNLGDVVFPNGGEISIKNSADVDISVKMTFPSNAGVAFLIKNPKQVVKGATVTFQFDANGKLQPDNGFEVGVDPPLAEAISIILLQNDKVTQIGTDFKLDKFTTGKAPDEDKTQACNCDTNPANNTKPCRDCEALEALPKDTRKLEGLIYYDFQCKKFYRIKRYRKGKNDTIVTPNAIIIRKNDTTVNDTTLVDLRHKALRNNTELQLKIVNINRYLYNPIVKTSNVNYESEMPLLLQKLFFPDSGSVAGLLALGKNGASSITQSTSGEKMVPDEISKFIDKLFIFQKEYNRLQSDILKAYEVCSNFPCCANRCYKDYGRIANNLLDINITYKKLKLAIPFEVEKTKKSIADTQARSDEMGRQITSLKNDKKTLTDSLQMIKDKLATIPVTTVTPTPAEITNLRKDSVRIEAAIKGNTTKSEALANNQVAMTAFIETKQQILIAYAQFDKLETTLPSEEDIKKAVLFANNIVAQQSTFITPPWYVSGNRHEIMISVKPREGSMISNWDIMPYYNDFSYFDLPVIGKGFVSFSSGSFLALPGDFYNKTYDWQKVPNNVNSINPVDSAKYLLKETGYSQLPIGFSALINAEWKVSEACGFGLSCGVGLTLEKSPRLAYLGGGSIFFGNLNQVALTGGFAGMNVDKLNVNLQAVSNQNITYTFRDKISYYSEFKVGGFLAVTYTPFKAIKRPVYNSARKSAKQAKADAFDAKEEAVSARKDANDAAVKADKAIKDYTDAKRISDSLKTIADNAATASTTAQTNYTKNAAQFTKDSASYVAAINKPESADVIAQAKKTRDASEKLMIEAKTASETAAQTADNAKKAYDKAQGTTTDSKTSMDDAKQKSVDLDKKATAAEKKADDLRIIAEAAAVTASAANNN